MRVESLGEQTIYVGVGLKNQPQNRHNATEKEPTPVETLIIWNRKASIY